MSVLSFLGGFAGVEIIVSDHLFPSRREQVRFPRSKRKRIRRKWSKNADNWRVVKGRGLVKMGRRFICDSQTADELRRALDVAGGAS